MKEVDKVEDDSVLVMENQRIYEFRQFSCADVRSLVQKSAKKTCTHAPMPTSMVIACLEELLPVITCILNSSLGSGHFSSLKEALVHPRLKVTRPSYFLRLPSYFEALWYPHLYFDQKSNI